MATYYWSSTSSTDPAVGANWTKSDGTTGAVPANGDSVIIQAVPGSTLANIGASNQSAIALASLTISQTYTGTIGTNVSIGGYWQIGASAWSIGTPANDGTSPSGSGRIKIDFGSATSFAGSVINTGSSTDTGYETVRLLCANASNVLNVIGGRSVGLATNGPGETATVGTVNVSGGRLNLGSGVTWTAANVSAGGQLVTNSAGTTLTVSSGGTATCQGTGGAITNVNNGGTCYLNHRPATAITTLKTYSGGTSDFSGNPASTTVTNHNLYGGGTLRVNAANPGHITITTPTLLNAGTVAAS